MGMDAKVQEFLDRLAEVLEVPSIGIDDDFRSVPMWSSLVGFSVMVMFDLEYGRGLAADELKGARTVRDLVRYAGVLGGEDRA